MSRQPKGYIQFWELLKRQIVVYLRNPIMSTSRFIAGVCTALFFGGAFWQLGRNAGGYDARCAEGFAYKLMVPGFGSAAIAYWVEKRKQFYHEEAAGYYHRLYHLIVMYFVEWIFVSAVMVSFAIGLGLFCFGILIFLHHFVFRLLSAVSCSRCRVGEATRSETISDI
jgi:hypothetical protein